MIDVDTLFVISSRRGEYPLDDLVASINAHNPNGSHFIVVVDESQQLSELPTMTGNYRIVYPDGSDDVHAGFKRAQGLRWAIDEGIAYKQVIMLDDTCLIRGGPIGDFWLDQIQRDGLGVIGVGHTPNYGPRWRSLVGLLYEWDLPHQNWEKVPAALHDAFLVLSPQLVGHLYQKNLLIPPGPERWTATYGAYISWVAQLLNFHIVAWGYTHKTLPPLCITSPGQYAPAPHILADRFMVCSPVGAVSGYSESDLRELFKQQRGEQARQLPAFGPTVYGPEQQGATP